MIKNSELISKLSNKQYYKTRNGKIFYNVSATIILKFINMFISFLMVPITLDYLDKVRYGLWAALSSVLSWFFIFDIGIGNGLRNKYIELKAKDKISEARSYVSTAYALFGILILIIIIVFFVANHFISWYSLLKAPIEMQKELSDTVLVVFSIMCINFIVKLINVILKAELKNALCDIFTVISHLISFLGIITLSHYTTPSLLKYAVLYTTSNVVVTVIGSIVLYNGILRDVSPKINCVNFKLRKDILNVGIKFFIIQIMTILFFQTSSFFISVLIGPEAVVGYNVTQKYFSIGSMIFYMLAEPLWSAYGDAYHKEDFSWIKSTFRRLLILYCIVVFGLIIMIAVQKPFFKLWLKNKVEVDYILSGLFVVFYSLQMYTIIYNSFINATSKLRLSMITSIFIVPAFIPAVFLFTKYLSLGSKGILLALIIVQTIPAAILTPIQCHKILAGSKGIWQK